VCSSDLAGPHPVTITRAESSEPLIASYTLEELQNARDLPLLGVAQGQAAQHADTGATLAQSGPPELLPGWDPQSGMPQPDRTKPYTLGLGPVSLGATFGSEPTDPLNGPYAPFQRWTWYGNYAAQKTQTIGKLFFDTDGDSIRDSSCSASVIGLRTIITAARCAGPGTGSYYGFFLFCPAYYKGAGSGAPKPGYGCWDWTDVVVPGGWFFGADPDRDHACIVTTPTGDTYPGKVGAKTGYSGVAYNWPSNQFEFSWGYPHVAPFPAAGYHIIAAVSPEWYEVDNVGGGPVSKYIGNDMTDGATGGPWWMGMSHISAEYADVDGSSNTDPISGLIGPWVNGVNSDRRCAGLGCSTYPPTTTDGPYWQEMGSPQFLDDFGGYGGADNDQAADIVATCLLAE